MEIESSLGVSEQTDFRALIRNMLMVTTEGFKIHEFPGEVIIKIKNSRSIRRVDVSETGKTHLNELYFQILKEIFERGIKPNGQS
jgi:hypothetical protein